VENGNGEALVKFLDPSAVSRHRQYESETVLHLAARGALVKIFDLFLEHGGDPAAPNKALQTCLHSVCTADLSSLRPAAAAHALSLFGAGTEAQQTGSDEALLEVCQYHVSTTDPSISHSLPPSLPPGRDGALCHPD